MRNYPEAELVRGHSLNRAPACVPPGVNA